MGPAEPELALRASSLWLIVLLGVTLVALSLVSMWKERHCPSLEIRSEGQVVRKSLPPYRGSVWLSSKYS